MINVKKELFVIQRENLKYIRCRNIKDSKRPLKNLDSVQKEEDNSKLDGIEYEVQPQFVPYFDLEKSFPHFINLPSKKVKINKRKGVFSFKVLIHCSSMTVHDTRF